MKNSIAALALCALTGTASAAIVNGGFETGDFTGWTLFGNTDYSTVESGYAHTGTYRAVMGPDPVGGFYQNINTTAGATYTIDFWLHHVVPSGTPATFELSFGGTSLYSQSLPAGQSYDWTQFTYTGTATGSVADVRFSFYDPNAYWYIDDISVTETLPSVPAPGSFALLLVAGLSMGAAVRPWRSFPKLKG